MLKKLLHTISLILVLIAVSFAGLGCANDKTAPKNEQQTESRVVQVESIDIPEGQLENRGDIQKAWRVNENLVLLEQVWHQDYNYYLLDSRTGDMDWIVPFIENARMNTITDETIQFIAKGGGDCGDFVFPYCLSFSLDAGKLAREPLFFAAGRGIRHHCLGTGIDQSRTWRGEG